MNFLEKNAKKLKNIKIGCSFAPEEFGLSPQNTTKQHIQAIRALEIIIHDLNIKYIRLGIRWNNAVDKEENLNLSFYKPYLDLCFAYKANICLNVGPIKTFRWPEDYVPKSVLDKIKPVPAKGSVIDFQSNLAKEALIYLDTLSSYLKTNYRDDQLSYIKVIQPENEPFYKFGEHKWIMGTDYLKSVIKKICDYFPEKQILISGGVWQTGKILNFFDDYVKDDDKLKNRLILGINYYYKFPPFHNIPIIKNIDLARLQGQLRGGRFIERIRQTQYKTEITEVQTEPWGKIISPGNSFPEFISVLQKCTENLLNPDKDSILRVWGIEYLLKKFMSNTLTSNQKNILNLIKTINEAKL